MKGSPLCSLMLLLLILCPVKIWSKDKIYKSQREASESAIWKRSHGIDYDSFVGLMGRRSTAPSKGSTDHMYRDLLSRRTSESDIAEGNARGASPLSLRYLQKNNGRHINHERQRIQESLKWL
ncbi:tachykinin-3b isoform 2-T2 [Menidia menidia]